MSASTTPTPSTTTAPAMVPASQVIPFPLPWGNIPGCAPGCVPGGGMDALMKCYMDIKAAMAFIGKVMIDLVNNDPSVAQAIIAAIEKSGSSLPLLGVTNGSNAQPGQVGEFVMMTQDIAYPITSQTTTVSMGVLQPGDWDVWAYANFSTFVADGQFYLNPMPAGFTGALEGIVAMTESLEVLALWAGPVRANISVPTLVPMTAVTNDIGNGPAAGTMALNFCARRMR